MSASPTTTPTPSRPQSTVPAPRSSLIPQPRPKSVPVHQSPHASPRRYAPTSPRPSPAPAPVGAKDFSFLLRPEIYHPLTALNTPAVFRSSPKQPHTTTPLPSLLANGHFRAAAVAAVHELTSTLPPFDPNTPSSYAPPPPVGPSDTHRIFSLIYTRLACLVLIGAIPLAAQEARALEDLNNPARYVDDVTGEHLAPWELRVLSVRLQAIGFGDPRRAVMSYYELAREARERISCARASESPDSSGLVELWTGRLHDLGVRVAGALVEMDDLVGAATHLATLKDRGDAKIFLAKALVWLQVGDTEAATRCVHECGGNGHADKIVAALCDMASAAYGPALEKWRALGETVEDEMVQVNAAICLLYLGRISEGRELLEKLVGHGYKSQTLLFNLSTMYELCSDRNKDHKLNLAETLAGLEEGPLGWERTSTELKMT